MATFYVGVDVHSKWSAYVIQREGGEIVGRGQVPTDLGGFSRMRSEHGLPAGTRVGLESGTMAFFAAQRLEELGLVPVVVDAHEVRLKAYRPRQKSDRRDAVEICEGIRRDLYRSIVHVPSEPVVRLRETLSRRRHFVRIQTSEINAVKHLLRAAGLRNQYRSLHTESGWKRIAEVVAHNGRLSALIESHYQVWCVADEQVKVLEESLLEQSRFFETDFRRLQTVPGVGFIVALTVISALVDANRFPSAKHAASYGGLVPSTNQSGDRDWHGHITKKGPIELRTMLVQAAHHCSRRVHPLNPYFRQLCVKKGYKRATVAMAHRLIRVLFAMLRDQTDFDPGKLGIEVGPFERKVVEPYRLKRARVRH